MDRHIYIFDTTIVSSLFHEQQKAILKRIRHDQTNFLVLCEPVIYEIERGLKHKKAEKQLTRFRGEVIPLFSTVPVQLADWRVASVLWADTRSKGFQLSDIDLLIAAVTLRLGGILVTSDDDFAVLPVPRENWQRP